MVKGDWLVPVKRGLRVRANVTWMALSEGLPVNTDVSTARDSEREGGRDD